MRRRLDHFRGVAGHRDYFTCVERESDEQSGQKKGGELHGKTKTGWGVCGAAQHFAGAVPVHQFNFNLL